MTATHEEELVNVHIDRVEEAHCIGEGANETQRIAIAKEWIKRNPVA